MTDTIKRFHLEKVYVPKFLALIFYASILANTNLCLSLTNHSEILCCCLLKLGNELNMNFILVN